MTRGDGPPIRSAIGSSRRAETGCGAIAPTGRSATTCSLGFAAVAPVTCKDPDKRPAEELVMEPAALAPAAEPGGAKYGAEREPVCRKIAFATTMVLSVAAARIAT